MGGLGPMSARKFSKLFHLSHTLIPRPPQSGHLGCLGLRHRCRINFQPGYPPRNAEGITTEAKRTAASSLRLELNLKGEVLFRNPGVAGVVQPCPLANLAPLAFASCEIAEIAPFVPNMEETQQPHHYLFLHS